MRLRIGIAMVFVATRLVAQTPSAAKPDLAGRWQLDASRIKPGPVSLSGMLRCTSAESRMPRAALIGERVPSGAEGWDVASGGLAERRGRPMVQDARPPGFVLIALREHDLTINDEGEGIVIWPVDGVKHIEAQTDGGALEVTSRWKGSTLVTERRDPSCKIGVRREYTVQGDGKQLELKILINTVFIKQEFKFYYDRDANSATPGSL